MNLADLTDEELARAVHFIDGHMDSLDPQELRAFRVIRDMVLRTAEQLRAVDADDERTRTLTRPGIDDDINR